MSLAFPIAGPRPRISSPFGTRKHPVTGEHKHHNGIDISVAIGTPVVAPADGNVAAVFENNVCGNGIILEHPSLHLQTAYCHLSRQDVRRGERVRQGQQIGLSGNTGRSTGPHLHWIVKEPRGGDWEAVDPTTHLLPAGTLAESGYAWPDFSAWIPDVSSWFAPAKGTWSNQTGQGAALVSGLGSFGPGDILPGRYTVVVNGNRLADVQVEEGRKHVLRVSNSRYVWE